MAGAQALRGVEASSPLDCRCTVRWTRALQTETNVSSHLDGVQLSGERSGALRSQWPDTGCN